MGGGVSPTVTTIHIRIKSQVYFLFPWIYSAEASRAHSRPRVNWDTSIRVVVFVIPKLTSNIKNYKNEKKNTK